MSRPVARATGSREPVLPRSNDVLLGRGRIHWGGNQLFDMEIRRNAQRYGAAETKHDKTAIVREIIRTVQKWGRFLDQEPAGAEGSGQHQSVEDAEASSVGLQSGDWYLASYVKIRKKVGQVRSLRYNSSSGFECHAVAESVFR